MRDLVRHGLSEPLAAKIGGDDATEQAAMLLAVLFGTALMRQNFQLPGLTEKSTSDLNAQTRHLAKAALNFKPT